jgi:hypothetical protein
MVSLFTSHNKMNSDIERGDSRGLQVVDAGLVMTR